MESVSVVKKENVEFEDEAMDISEAPTKVYCEEGEISSSDDEDKSVTLQMPSNVTSIFTRHYRKDQAGGFVTGFNIFDKDETQKKLDRAKRFALPVQAVDSEEVHKEKLSNLYRDLGIDKENERHYRFNAVHLRGTNNMSTEDVLQYFASYAPSHVEWINDVSCNIVWMDDVSAARALLNLSKRIKNLDKVHLNADPFERDFKDYSPSEEFNDEEAVDAREIKTAIPPGYWRIGLPCQKSSILLLRFATRSDKKQRNAEKNSEYYKKYGNPHFGNMPGLISNSFRTEIRKSRNKGTDFNTTSGPNKKNPWEDLAFEWGATDKVEEPHHHHPHHQYHHQQQQQHHQNFVRSNIIQNQNSVPDLRISLTNRKQRAKRLKQESDTSPYSSDKEIWESKSKIPRMKMYADDEEKRIEKNLEKKFQNNPVRRQPEKDLRSKINSKKTRLRVKFRSEKKVKAESSESSSNENEFDEADSGDWALEQYHDLRESLQQNRRQERKRFRPEKYESESEGDENADYEIYKGDFNRRSPLQIEIENDEYYLHKD